MASDFRTANLQKNLQGRIAYLEKLLSESEDLLSAGRVQEELDRCLAALREVREEAAEEVDLGNGDTSGETHLPNLTLPQKHTYSVYLPSPTARLRWEEEARQERLAHGDHNDGPRRILVLLHVLDHLLRVLQAEGVQLDELDGTEDQPLLAPTE